MKTEGAHPELCAGINLAVELNLVRSVLNETASKNTPVWVEHSSARVLASNRFVLHWRFFTLLEGCVEDSDRDDET